MEARTRLGEKGLHGLRHELMDCEATRGSRRDRNGPSGQGGGPRGHLQERAFATGYTTDEVMRGS